jgi:hypothetical protein
VALNSQHKLSHALQSCIASTWTTASRRSASKPSFWHRQVRHYGLKTLNVVQLSSVTVWLNVKQEHLPQFKGSTAQPPNWQACRNLQSPVYFAHPARAGLQETASTANVTKYSLKFIIEQNTNRKVPLEFCRFETEYSCFCATGSPEDCLLRLCAILQPRKNNKRSRVCSRLIVQPTVQRPATHPHILCHCAKRTPSPTYNPGKYCI